MAVAAWRVRRRVPSIVLWSTPVPITPPVVTPPDPVTPEPEVWIRVPRVVAEWLRVPRQTS